jgi:hypothetical protein
MEFESETDIMTGLVEDLQIDSNGMLVDEAEYFNGDRPDVAIITPDSSIDEPESEPLADDCTSYYLFFKAQAPRYTYPTPLNAQEQMRPRRGAQILPEVVAGQCLAYLLVPNDKIRSLMRTFTNSLSACS